MGKTLLNKGGNADTSEDMTATKADVLIGKTYIGNDTNDDIGTGEMPNIGTVTAVLVPDDATQTTETYAINTQQDLAYGYHNGNGVLSAPTFAQLTPGTATAGTVWSGKTVYVGGAKVEGTGTANNTNSASCTGADKGTMTIKWTYPSGTFFSGVSILVQGGSTAPTSSTPATASTCKYNGAGSYVDATTRQVSITGLSYPGFYSISVYAYTWIDDERKYYGSPTPRTITSQYMKCSTNCYTCSSKESCCSACDHKPGCGSYS